MIVPKRFAERACAGFAQLGTSRFDHYSEYYFLKIRMVGARGVSLMFSSGDLGVGDGNPDPATQQCFSNDGYNVTKFIPLFPASCVILLSMMSTF